MDIAPGHRKETVNRIISLVSHASKVMLKVTQSCISTTVEELLSDEQAKLTLEQVFNCRILIERHL